MNLGKKKLLGTGELMGKQGCPYGFGYIRN